jgi:hypothetical protein
VRTIGQSTRVTATVIAGLALLPGIALGQAQQTPVPEKPSVAPQIELDGTGIATLEGHFPRFTLPNGVRSSTSRINVSDSALLLGVSQSLFHNGGIGSFVIGATSTEGASAPSGTNFFLHQLYLDYQAKKAEGYIGRTDTATRLVDFPTIRGDDLNEFVNVLNPFSNGDNVEEHRYSDQAALILNRKLRYFVNLHAQHLITGTPNTIGQGGLNSYGVSFQYQGAPTLEAIQKIPLWGLGYERRSVASGNGGPSDVAYGGIVYNINPDPTDRVDVRLQDIYTFSNSLTGFADVTDTFRAGSNSIAAAVRYLHSPFGVPGYQVSLTAGYKSFNRVSNAGTVALALTGVKRLGDGFDLVLQYEYQHRAPVYAAVFSGVKDEHSIQIGFVFNFNNTFNQHLGPRRSLLNLQHQYLPE